VPILSRIFQMTENGGQMTENGKQITDVRYSKPAGRGWLKVFGFRWKV